MKIPDLKRVMARRSGNKLRTRGDSSTLLDAILLRKVSSSGRAAGIDSNAAGAKPADPTSEQEHRQSLLAVMNHLMARKQNARLKYVIGEAVVVAKGNNVGDVGRIEDIDYIKSRILVRLTNAENPLWLAYQEVHPPKS